MRQLLLSWLLCVSCLAGATAMAATSAGTSINNSVTATWSKSGVAQPPTSASASFTVAQLVQLQLSWQDASDVSVPAGAVGTLSFRLTNSGNGTDTASLVSSLPPTPVPSFVPASCQTYLDTDASGTLTTGDSSYAAGVNDPVLTAGESLDVFVSCQVPSGTADASQALVQIEASSQTLTGVNNSQCLTTAVCGSTQDPTLGAWAVTDASGGKVSAQGRYKSTSPSFNFLLTQSVDDGAGGQVVKSGSIVTYTMEVDPTSSSTAYDTRVTDSIPANTTYVPNSMTLDGVGLTDAADSDAGYFNSGSNQIEITLGQRAANAATQVITFNVTIN